MNAGTRNLPKGVRAPARISAVFCGVVMALLVLAGIAKLVELSAFWEYLHQNLGAPRGTVLALAVTLPVIEVGVGGLWFANVHRRRMACAALLLLMGFSLFLGWSVSYGRTSGCSCFGALKVLDAGAVQGIARNVIMAVVVGAYLAKGRTPGARAGALRPARDAGGFALVEVGVVIAIAVILGAIAIPALARARDRARDAATLALMRQHGAVMLAYAADHADAFPYFTDPARATTPVFHSSGVGLDARYFEAFYLWPVALSDAYYAGSLSPALWTPPSTPAALRRARFGVGYILYPCVFLAHPEYWALETRLLPPSQLQPTRTASVSFPSSKVLLYSRFPGELLPDRAGARHPVAAVDGHATSVDRGAEPSQTPFGDGGWSPWSFHRFSHEPFLHTTGGIRAREF